MVKLKNRNSSPKRKTKRIILISTEGKNKTEETYFSHFGGRDKDYLIKFAEGNNTDPCGILKAAKKSIRKEELDLEDGDAVYCVFDVDNLSWRHDAIKDVLKDAEKDQINIILSNPCFEIWFLLHYTYTTRCFSSNDEVIRALQRYIPDYEKNKDIFDKLLSSQSKAIENSQRLDSYHDDNGISFFVGRNPSTDVYKLIEEFQK